MHLHQNAVMKTAALLLLLPFLPATFVAANPAVAPPPPPPAKKDVTTYSTKPADNSFCDTGDSEFTNASSTGSPLVADCKKLSSIMKSAPDSDYPWGFWTVNHCIGNCKFMLVSYGTCAFGVSSDGVFGLYTIGITREDIAALLDASIAKFTWFEQVGAEGHMNCQPMNDVTGTPLQQDRHGTAWAVYHS